VCADVAPSAFHVGHKAPRLLSWSAYRPSSFVGSRKDVRGRWGWEPSHSCLFSGDDAPISPCIRAGGRRAHACSHALRHPQPAAHPTVRAQGTPSLSRRREHCAVLPLRAPRLGADILGYPWSQRFNNTVLTRAVGAVDCANVCLRRGVLTPRTAARAVDAWPMLLWVSATSWLSRWPTRSPAVSRRAAPAARF